MDLVNVTVHLAGDRNFAIPKRGITVAETVLLRALHGDASVVNVRRCGSIDRSLQVEMARLTAIYGNKPTTKDAIVAMFANAHMQGLLRVEDIAQHQTSEMIEAAELGSTDGGLQNITAAELGGVVSDATQGPGGPDVTDAELAALGADLAHTGAQSAKKHAR
jgi:hypothetical protein